MSFIISLEESDRKVSVYYAIPYGSDSGKNGRTSFISGTHVRLPYLDLPSCDQLITAKDIEQSSHEYAHKVLKYHINVENLFSYRIKSMDSSSNTHATALLVVALYDPLAVDDMPTCSDIMDDMDINMKLLNLNINSRQSVLKKSRLSLAVTCLINAIAKLVTVYGLTFPDSKNLCKRIEYAYIPKSIASLIGHMAGEYDIGSSDSSRSPFDPVFLPSSDSFGAYSISLEISSKALTMIPIQHGYMVLNPSESNSGHMKTTFGNIHTSSIGVNELFMAFKVLLFMHGTVDIKLKKSELNIEIDASNVEICLNFHELYSFLNDEENQFPEQICRVLRSHFLGLNSKMGINDQREYLYWIEDLFYKCSFILNNDAELERSSVKEYIDKMADFRYKFSSQKFDIDGYKYELNIDISIPGWIRCAFYELWFSGIEHLSYQAEKEVFSSITSELYRRTVCDILEFTNNEKTDECRTLKNLIDVADEVSLIDLIFSNAKFLERSWKLSRHEQNSKSGTIGICVCGNKSVIPGLLTRLEFELNQVSKYQQKYGCLSWLFRVPTANALWLKNWGTENCTEITKNAIEDSQSWSFRTDLADIIGSCIIYNAFISYLNVAMYLPSSVTSTSASSKRFLESLLKRRKLKGVKISQVHGSIFETNTSSSEKTPVISELVDSRYCGYFDLVDTASSGKFKDGCIKSPPSIWDAYSRHTNANVNR